MGNGFSTRELMHVDDLASGLLFWQNESPPDWVNLGTGVHHSIQEIANLVKEVIGYDGRISNDLSKPDGMPLKRLDVSLAEKLGWKAKIRIEEGLRRTYEEFCDSLANNTARL